MSHNSTIKAVLALYKNGHSIVKIAKALNLHIEEVADILNQYYK